MSLSIEQVVAEVVKAIQALHDAIGNGDHSQAVEDACAALTSPPAAPADPAPASPETPAAQ